MQNSFFYKEDNEKLENKNIESYPLKEFNKLNSDDNDKDDFILTDYPTNETAKNAKDDDFILTDQHINEAAKKAVEEVGPRMYELTGFIGSLADFWFIACHGSQNDAQKIVAKGMNDYMQKTGIKPVLIFMGGDNLYDYGATKPNDDIFKRAHTKIYEFGIPSILTAGNHDLNMHKKSKLGKLYGLAALINECAHTYLPDGSQQDMQSVSDLRDFFKQEKIDIKKLQSWVMPYYFGGFWAKNLDFFNLNSCTLVKDFLNHLRKKKSKLSTPINQFEWLLQEKFKIKPGQDPSNKATFYNMHFPVFPLGKRSDHKHLDTYTFLSKKNVKALQDHFGIKTDSQYEFLALIFEEYALWPDTILNGHEHAQSVVDVQLALKPLLDEYRKIQELKNSMFKNKPENNLNLDAEDLKKSAPIKTIQICNGGGGGDLEKRRNFAAQDSTGFFLSEHGFLSIKIDLVHPKKFEFEFPMNYGLRFNNSSLEPLREPSQDKSVEVFRELIIAASKTYFQSLSLNFKIEQEAKNQFKSNLKSLGYFGNTFHAVYENMSSLSENISTGFNKLINKSQPEDADYVQTLFAYINQPHPPELKSVAKLFCEQIKKLSDQTYFHIFYRYLHSASKDKDRQASCISIQEAIEVAQKELQPLTPAYNRNY